MAVSFCADCEARGPDPRGWTACAACRALNYAAMGLGPAGELPPSWAWVRWAAGEPAVRRLMVPGGWLYQTSAVDLWPGAADAKDRSMVVGLTWLAPVFVPAVYLQDDGWPKSTSGRP